MSDSAAEESPAQRAARIRREKREKKITAGGADRLARITGISGREQDLQPQSPPKPTVSSPDADVDDPAEIDISRSPPTFTSPSARSIPATSSSSSSSISPDEAQLRAALRARAGETTSNAPQDPFLALMQQAQGGNTDANDANGDPMMQMLQQIFQPAPGGTGPNAIPGAAGTPGGPPGGLPPGLASLLNGGAPAQAQASPAASSHAYIWRILHALFSLALGLYVALILPFDGTREGRVTGYEGAGTGAAGRNVFWIFATAELGLQSARYVLEKGAPVVIPGWMGTVVGLLPQVWGEYVRLAMRYAGYWTTLVEDTMGVVFMLGVVAWWKSGGRVEL